MPITCNNNFLQTKNILFKLHRQFRPIAVGYEEYGLQADLQHFEDRMEKENYRFKVVPLGGRVSKEDRILWLQPLVESNKLYLPEMCIHMDYTHEQVNNTRAIVEEFRLFPFAPHDDILDALSRIRDPNFQIVFPSVEPQFLSPKRQSVADSEFDPLADFPM
jgi:phage terminase large subunit-like protein